MDNGIHTWAVAARAAYRQCVANGVSRKAARLGILAGLKRQGWDKRGTKRG